jgi:hypothetical protein
MVIHKGRLKGIKGISVQCHYLKDKSNGIERQKKRWAEHLMRYDKGVKTKQHNAGGSAQMDVSKKVGKVIAGQIVIKGGSD